MTDTSFGLLATMIIGMLTLLSQTVTVTKAMALPNKGPVTLFNLPTHIDEDELLSTYGRFMLGNMNHTMDPCEDFYEYACGNWKKAEMVPPKSRNDTFLHSIQNAIDDMMQRFLLNSTEQELKLGTAEAKAKLFFSSCMQMSKDLEHGHKQLLDLEEFTSKLEHKEDSNSSENEWIKINFLSKHGVYPLLPLKVHYNTESRKFELLISPPVKFLSVSEIVDVKNLTRDLHVEGVEKQQQFVEELAQMIVFEKNLTSLISKRNETEMLPLGDFLRQHQQDKLNWTLYFQLAFNGTTKNEWMIHNTIENVSALVKFLQRTDLNTQRNYVKWRTLLKFYYLWKPAIAPDVVIEENCRSQTEQYFNYALIPWFIENLYDSDRRADIYTVGKYVKQNFYDLLDKYTWLDDETRSNAKTKLRAMDLQVGYNDEMKHRTAIDQIYNDLVLSEDWHKNVLAVEANRERVRMRSINKAIIPALMSTRSVNAYYADFLNLAFITIGISQLPFYHIKFPPSLKFGGIGNIIGHEMAHGFDSYCYQFNYDGKKQNWWTEASLRNFRERYRCMESQYNKMIYHGVATNGSLTSGDNIADNLGMRIAYYAYMQAYGKQDGDRKPILGVNYTNKQLFFLKFAQTWCTGRDDDSKFRRMKSDPHAYEEFRVVGTLSNMPEFSEAFKCKLGSDMNPLKKCVVW